MKRTAQERMERAAFWRRAPWPVVVLGVDPAEGAGAAIATPEEKLPGYHVEGGPEITISQEVATNTRALEAILDTAAGMARRKKLKLAVVLEEWGSGGKLGIKTWLGLGAAAGAWKRAVILAAMEQHKDVLLPRACLLSVPQTRWRSQLIEESGTRDAAGKYKNFTSEQWKEQAQKAVRGYFPLLEVPGPNAAEATLIALYGARCLELGELLPKWYLKEHGRER